MCLSPDSLADKDNGIISKLIFMLSLRKEHEASAYRGNPCVCVSHVQNDSTDFDEIYY
jgi:hypothetical protein